MGVADRWAKQLVATFSSAKTASPPVKMRVIDVSRKTVLASTVEVADTSAKRSKGLLGRNSLGPGEGLWIVPCESVHTFGMRFAIDLVYLDREHRIRKIRRNVVPWRVSLCLSAHSVIELASGSIRDQDAQLGDKVEFAPINS